MSTGSSKTHKRSSVVNCDCGMRAPICISNRPWSRGRRFYGCSQLEEWYDKKEDNGVVEDLKDDWKCCKSKSGNSKSKIKN
ncbi:hypothetical protein GQ457_16G028450 [Hibiscus cannabinus]